ncbi:MAG: hypothetical protein MR987_08505 [Oscillospiraceae bacterium]|nr:hypothetical protein [Oscillospiraceae bacterium]
MPEGGRTSYEHEIEEKLKKLDAKINVPEIPDAQAIFERAEKKKNNIFSIRTVRYAAAAAVILICVSIPVATTFMAKNNAAPDASDALMYAAYGNGTVESSEEKSTESEPYFGDVSSSAEESEPQEERTEDGFGSANRTVTAEEALAEYFSDAAKKNPSTGGSSEAENASKSFTDKLNKKRLADVEINDDSVSVMLYDISGQSEILTALWVEGAFESAGVSDDYYVITVSKAVTREEFESGYYMPMIGSPEGGTSYLSEDEVLVSDTVEKAVFTISISINIENGGYEIYATLA